MKFLRCDNGGEQLNLKQRLIDEGLGEIVVEYTSPRTPQQNGLVERAFAVIYSTIRAMFEQAGLPGSLREKCWEETVGMATFLNNWSISARRQSSPAVLYGHSIRRPLAYHQFG